MQFIILPRYITSELTTNTSFVSLKDVGNNNLLTNSSKQSCSCIRSQLVKNIQKKWVMAIESNDDLITQLIHRIKIKKLIRKEFIIAEIDKWTSQNITCL